LNNREAVFTLSRMPGGKGDAMSELTAEADPAEELTVSFFTQLLPSSAHPIRPQLRQLVYQALSG
jgi:hypothetical protein